MGNIWVSWLQLPQQTRVAHYEFRDRGMWSDFRKLETCRVEHPDSSVVMLQAFMKGKVIEFSGFIVLHTCQSKLLFWDIGLQIQKSN